MAQQENLLRPWLNLAVICEKILQERDGAISIIRVIDRWNFVGAAKEMGPQVMRFHFFIMFRAGILRGKQRIHIRPHSPSGQDLPAMEFPVLFEGDDERGIAVATEAQIGVDQEGLYWFDVYLEDELVTRMPLRVTYQQTGMPMAGH
jgi:hypothetical protein